MDSPLPPLKLRPARPEDRMLAPLRGQVPPAPAWFKAALEREPERSFITVKGATIETLSWGRRGARGLLLLHGQGANADWWSFIAPFFADDFRVTALSWSGMGRSDWRDVYDFGTFAEEMFAAAAACGQFDCAQKPVIAAHSFGGIPLMYGARERGHDIGGAVIIDCYFRPDTQPPRTTSPLPAPGFRHYPTIEDALARFRLEPVQQCENLFIVDYIARQSLKQDAPRGSAPAGWTWRFDPALRLKTRKTAIAPYLTGMPCPLVIMSGENSALLTPPVRAYIHKRAPAGTPWIMIPEADHHVMLDQPLALTAALRSLFAVWPP